MHVPINFKSPNNISKWKMGFNSAFKEMNCVSNCPVENVMHYMSSVKECTSFHIG
jgi:hypothetical protein